MPKNENMSKAKNLTATGSLKSRGRITRSTDRRINNEDKPLRVTERIKLWNEKYNRVNKDIKQYDPSKKEKKNEPALNNVIIKDPWKEMEREKKILKEMERIVQQKLEASHPENKLTVSRGNYSMIAADKNKLKDEEMDEKEIQKWEKIYKQAVKMIRRETLIKEIHEIINNNSPSDKIVTSSEEKKVDYNDIDDDNDDEVNSLSASVIENRLETLKNEIDNLENIANFTKDK